MIRLPLARPRFLAAAVVLGLTTLSACGTAATGESDADPERTVAAAFYPLAWVSEQIAGDAWTVQNLTSPGAEPHDLELSINQTVLVSDAALVVHEEGLQPAVDTAVDKNASGDVLDAAAVVDLKAIDESAEEHGADDHGADDHASDDHDHGDRDPHFWIDPVRMATLGDAIAAKLGELDPDNAAGFAKNAADLRSELEALDTEYVEGLASCARTDVVVGHDAFGYLDKYGLQVQSILGLSPEAEPSAATLSELSQLIEENGVTTVFTETLASPQAAEALAREAGVETAVLDPVEGLSKSTADEDYLSLMRANLAALQEANDC